MWGTGQDLCGRPVCILPIGSSFATKGGHWHALGPNSQCVSCCHFIVQGGMGIVPLARPPSEAWCS
eukprot:13380127-Heterocapsa_arctica.AAC.1